jgi:2-polyprenyl-3-methyl-5-hydroxy-6-metoxy-1,4-benzoquinol methylase
MTKPVRIEHIYRVWFDGSDSPVDVKRTGERNYSGVDDEVWLGMYEVGYRCWSRPDGPARVLDAGCGSGYGADFLTSVGCDVVAVDAADEAVLYATLRASGATVRQCNIEQLSGLGPQFTDFDAVFAIESVEHVQDETAMFGGFWDRMAPGGMLFISTPDKELLDASYSAAYPATPERPLNPYHVREYSEGGLREQLRLAGFEHAVRVRTVSPYEHALGMVCWKSRR